MDGSEFDGLREKLEAIEDAGNIIALRSAMIHADQEREALDREYQDLAQTAVERFVADECIPVFSEDVPREAESFGVWSWDDEDCLCGDTWALLQISSRRDRK